jgi:rhamnulokinase
MPRTGTGTFAAADLGATSGRVVLGSAGHGKLEITEVHRFANTPVRLPSGLHWNILALYQGVLDGLRQAARTTAIDSIGIDSWAVDYGLLDGDGRLLGLPYHYWDERTREAAQRIRSDVGAQELYQINGLQHVPFNTLYQLAAAGGTAELSAARTLLLVPDLLSYWLTGELGTEVTNASTTGLLDVHSGTWSEPLCTRLGVNPGLLTQLRRPGDPAGRLTAGAAAETGLPAATAVTVVASHDTASAVVAVPAAEAGFAYISCGTWSLVGLELDKPVLSAASRAANFTNEAGVDGTVRYLRNVMGLWLLEESRRAWGRRGQTPPLDELLAEAARAIPLASLIDPDMPEFAAPGDIPSRIREFCRRTGQPVPPDRGAVVRCILESLALAHRAALRQAAELAGRDISRVHLVGGGSRNALLCQLTADASGLPLIAGPSEATAIGNILIQARARGLVADLAGIRHLVAQTQRVAHYQPSSDPHAWESAAGRVAAYRA